MTALSPTRPGRRKPSGTLAGFILVRLVMMGLVVAVVSAVVFFLMEAAPGDAATQYLGDKATPERLAALRAELGLGDPAWSRYLDWAGATLTGDFGTSLASGREVSDLLAAPGIRTVVLASLAFVGVLVIGIGGGVRAGYRASEPTDRALSTFALIGLSLPEFVTGIALITVFALWLRVLPAVSFVPSSGNILERPDILILPAIALSVVAGCYVLRLVRGVVVSITHRPNVEAARLDGISPARILFVHVLPQAIGPTFSAIVVMVPYLVGGAVIVEKLFGYPGLGSMLITAVNGRDQPVVMAIMLVLSVVTVLGYTISDILARLADPYRRRVS